MKNPLSPNEFKIMQLLWKEDRPLFRPEIIEMIPDRDDERYIEAGRKLLDVENRLREKAK